VRALAEGAAVALGRGDDLAAGPLIEAPEAPPRSG
jgi:hypothetical protein